MKRLVALAALIAAPVLAQDGADWRTVATPDDRARLRDWRTAWVEGLAAARQDAQGSIVSANGVLLEPDRSLSRPLPPAGDYRCRTIRLGTLRAGQRTASEARATECRVDGDAPLRLTVGDGARRVRGRLYASTDARGVFLGALSLADETRTPRYGRVAGRDVAGYVERIGERRWRLVLPRPRFDAVIEVIELVPAV